MQSIMSNNFTLLRNFIDIINSGYGLIIGAKYHSSNMNDVHTKSSYDIVSHLAKVVQPTAFFLNTEHLFVQPLCQLPAGQPGVDS